MPSRRVQLTFAVINTTRAPIPDHSGGITDAMEHVISQSGLMRSTNIDLSTIKFEIIEDENA
jgi:hypothetical protein